jgi:hypothetical protein
MSDTDATFAAPQAEGLVARPNVGAACVSEAGVVAAGFESSTPSPTDPSTQTANIPNATAGAVGVQPAQLPYDPAGYVPVPTSIFWNMLSAGTPGPRGILDVAPTPGPPVVLGQPNGPAFPWPTTQAVAPNATAVTPSGVLSSGSCGCNNGAGPGNGKAQNIFALGLISYDFGTEARRDTFRQSMPNVGGIPANPFVPSGRPSRAARASRLTACWARLRVAPPRKGALLGNVANRAHESMSDRRAPRARTSSHHHGGML